MALITAQTDGVCVVAVTPFTDDLTVDIDGINRLTDFYIRAGATGLTVLGMMGEANKLSHEESGAVVSAFIAAAGGLPVIVGVSSPGMASMLALTREAMDRGAAGVMVAPPANLRTDDQIVSYYQMVGEMLGPDVPIAVQDFPLVTGVQMSVGVIGRIVETVSSVVMLKHEDWPGLAKIDAIRSAEARGQRRISILCGNGGIFLPEEMERGADGAMTGFAFPEMMRDVVALSKSGQSERALDLFDAYLPLVRYEQQPNLGLAARKYVLKKRGALASAAIRRPGPSLSAKDAANVETLLRRLERRLAELG